jgi:apolipoprotein N-acyltransferase
VSPSVNALKAERAGAAAWHTSRRVRLGLGLASALLLVLIFPRFGLTWLAPVALTPLLLVCALEASWQRRFLYGWAAGTLFWGVTCSWIQFVLEVHGGMGRWGGWGTFLLFAVLKGLHLGLFSALAGFVIGRAWAIPAIAALWTGIERTHGPLGFAWLDLGNAGIGMPVLMRLAPWFGVYGLSFAFAMLACALALVFLRRPRIQLSWLALFPALFLLPPPPVPEPGHETALVVQPNIDTEMQWTGQSLLDTQRRLALLSRTAGASMVVWPEVPAPFYPGDSSFREYLGEVARQAHADFLMGGVGRLPTGEPLNSAFLLDASGRLVDRYDKVNLVPFGEYVPPVFSWVNKITHEAGDFVPGTRVVVFPVDGHTTGAFICYESAFPDFVRQFTKDGAQLLVNLSNDGYFGNSAAREQHLWLVRMRAAENRRWLLRATNDGITAMVDPAGRVAQQLPGFVQTSANLHYNYAPEVTPYVRFGDWFAWSCLIAGLLACALALLA